MTPPSTIARYRITNKLGEGGTVYRTTELDSVSCCGLCSAQDTCHDCQAG